MKMRWGLLQHKNTWLSFHIRKKNTKIPWRRVASKTPSAPADIQASAEMNETVCTLCQSTEAQISNRTLKGKRFGVFVRFSCHNALLCIQQQTPTSFVVIGPNTPLCILRCWHIRDLNLLCRRTAKNSPWY